MLKPLLANSLIFLYIAFPSVSTYLKYRKSTVDLGSRYLYRNLVCLSPSPRENIPLNVLPKLVACSA